MKKRNRELYRNWRRSQRTIGYKYMNKCRPGAGNSEPCPPDPGSRHRSCPAISSAAREAASHRRSGNPHANHAHYPGVSPSRGRQLGQSPGRALHDSPRSGQRRIGVCHDCSAAARAPDLIAGAARYRAHRKGAHACIACIRMGQPARLCADAAQKNPLRSSKPGMACGLRLSPAKRGAISASRPIVVG